MSDTIASSLVQSDLLGHDAYASTFAPIGLDRFLKPCLFVGSVWQHFFRVDRQGVVEDVSQRFDQRQAVVLAIRAEAICELLINTKCQSARACIWVLVHFARACEQPRVAHRKRLRKARNSKFSGRRPPRFVPTQLSRGDVALAREFTLRDAPSISRFCDPFTHSRFVQCTKAH